MSRSARRCAQPARGDAEAGAGHAGDAHGLGGALGVLESRWARLHVLDDGGASAGLVAAEAAERHLHPLHLVGGGEQPVGGRATAGAWSSRPSSPTTRSDGAGSLATARIWRRWSSASRSSLRRRPARRPAASRSLGQLVGDGGGGGPLELGVEPLGAAERARRVAPARRRPRSSGPPARGRCRRVASSFRSASTPAVPDWRAAASARTRSSWASTWAYSRRAAPSWAVRSWLVERVELGLRARRPPAPRRAPPAAASVISARVARASRSSGGSSSRAGRRRHAEVGGLHQHQRAERLGEAPGCPTGDGAGEPSSS